MSERGGLYDLSWDVMEWLATHRWQRRAIIFATIVLAPFIIAALSGSSMFLALEVAGLQAGVLAVASLVVIGLRRAGLV
jgi:hypothetical protein